MSSSVMSPPRAPAEGADKCCRSSRRSHLSASAAVPAPSPYVVVRWKSEIAQQSENIVSLKTPLAAQDFAHQRSLPQHLAEVRLYAPMTDSTSPSWTAASNAGRYCSQEVLLADHRVELVADRLRPAVTASSRAGRHLHVTSAVALQALMYETPRRAA